MEAVVKVKDLWMRVINDLYDIPAYSQAVSFYRSAGIEQYLPSRTDFLRKDLPTPGGTDQLDFDVAVALNASLELGEAGWMNSMRFCFDENFDDAILHEALEDYLFVKQGSSQVEQFLQVYLPGAYLSGDLNSL